MGGGGSGPHPIGDVRKWIEQAKEELQASEQSGRRNVFLSFAYEDLNMVNLLRGQAKNQRLPLEFNDWSVSEPINSERAPYIKEKIKERILQSSATVVFISESTAKSDWVDWEIEESVRLGRHVIGVYPEGSDPRVRPSAIDRHGIACVPWPDLAATIAGLED